MKTSDAIIYNELVLFSRKMPASKQKGMVETLLKSIRALIVGELKNVNGEYLHTIKEAWSEIKNAIDPKLKLLIKATCKEVASFH